MTGPSWEKRGAPPVEGQGYRERWAPLVEWQGYPEAGAPPVEGRLALTEDGGYKQRNADRLVDGFLLNSENQVLPWSTRSWRVFGKAPWCGQSLVGGFGAICGENQTRRCNNMDVAFCDFVFAARVLTDGPPCIMLCRFANLCLYMLLWVPEKTCAKLYGRDRRKYSKTAAY